MSSVPCDMLPCVLVIRDAQREALRRGRVAQFADRVVGHLVTCCPERCALMDRGALRTLVSESLEQAGRWGMTSERDLCRFATVALFFGPAFDRDPELPWAGRILHSKKRDTYRSKADLLLEAAIEWLE